MIRLLTIFVLSGLIATACSKKEPYYSYTPPSTPPPVVPPPTSDTPFSSTGKRYLALGDSYTIGQGVSVASRFPMQAAQMLQSAGIAMQEPEIIATTGWTTTSLQNAITSRNPQGPYDMVTLLIGVNDQYQRHDTTGYRQRFTDLLRTAIQLSGQREQRVAVLSIPDYSVTPFASGSDTARIRKEIDMFNAINLQVTMQLSCLYIDITPSTRMAKTDASLVASDGLHPSGKEYQKWAMRLKDLMLTRLN